MRSRGWAQTEHNRHKVVVLQHTTQAAFNSERCLITHTRTQQTAAPKRRTMSTMAEAARATSVPVLPIATPISARRSAGASFTPSPVIEHTWPWRCRERTIVILSLG
jgi:hypothetical protein